MCHLHFGCYVVKAELFWEKKSFVLDTWTVVFILENFHLGCQDLGCRNQDLSNQAGAPIHMNR